MTDANESCETIMRELGNVVVSDAGDTEEERGSFAFHGGPVSDDIPPSLLSYFATSKSRAAVCERFIVEELEDSEYMMNLPIEPKEDMMKLNTQFTRVPENENNSSSDTYLLPSPTETEVLLTHSVSMCLDSENEDETDEHMGCNKFLGFKVRTLESSITEEEKKKSSECQRELREKRHSEEMKREEKRRQREIDFQEELKKIMEAEKLHQKELELMEKRAQEKLEQELLLQQELISNLQKRVEEERKKGEEEQERIKEEGERKKKEEEEKRKREEEDRRKREVEKIKREMERKRAEGETRRKKEEEEQRKIEEMRLKEELRRKKEEQQQKKRKEDEKRKREEEQNKIEEDKRKEEEEKRKREEEDRRKREVEKIKREMERKRAEEEMRRKKEEEEKSKIEEMRLEEQRRMKEEEGRKKEEEEKRIMKEGKNKIGEDMRKKEEERKIKEIRLKEEEKRRLLKEEGRKREENNNKREEGEVQRKKEEDTKLIEVARKKIKEDRGRKNEQEIRLQEEGRNSDDKDKRRKEEVKMNQEEMSKKEEERKTEEETRKTEVEKMMVAQMKRKEDENKNIEEMQVKEDEEKGKKDEERRCSLECKDLRKEEEENTKDEEWRMWQEEEMRLKKEMEWTKVYEAKNKEIGQERKTKDEKQRQEEKDDVKKREDGRQNVEADRRQIEEELRKNKEENIKAEGQRLKEEEESNKIIALGAENEERLMRANEQHEMKREKDGMKTQNENTRNTRSPQLKEGTILTPSSPRPLHGESTTGPSDSETAQQNKLHKDIGQTSVYKTTDRPDAAVEPCASPGSLPVCLLENAEQRRLSWMRDCVPWSKLSFHNRRKQKGCVDGRRGLRRAAKVGGLPPLCLNTLLQSSGYKSLQEVTTVTLEDLPGCSLSPLSQCAHLRSLTLRRCGLKSLEGINQLSQLCYIDVQENDISFMDCENMIGLRVLRLGHNKLMSIHGLSGAENLDLLDLSHNSITRIAGLESMKKLQRLSVDHNQLISTKGLRDVYTLLHLDCSHNHLASVEGLENSALLQTLDLRANSLTEPPSLNNHILLRELHLDDNSISSLRGLVVCWLPLMHHLSVAQNRITLLPPMCDFVSLANLDLRFNCMSELQNVCGSLEGCRLLQEVHLTGNPLQQESGWRSALQKAVAGLRAVNGQETDPSLSAPAVQWVGSASGSFLTLCQAQLRQTRDLQRRHSMELGDASSHLDAVNSSCRHFTETLELAVDQRLAHEYGDTAVSAAQTIPKKTPDADGTNAEHLEIEPNEKAPPVVPIRNNVSCSHWTLEETLSTENWRHALDTVTTALKIGSQSLAKKENSISSYSEMAPLYNGQDPDPKNTAAAMIQQRWRKYRQRCGSISSPPTAERGGGRGGEGGEPESGPFCFNRSVVGQDHAATIIQALWRGFTLRRRLASALAAVSCPDSAEDETFEEVDVDEFALDEAALEKHWTMLLSEESPSGHQSLSVEPPHLKPPWPFPEPSQFPLPPPPSWRPKQAWAAGEQVGSTGQRSSPESLRRSKSPGSASVLSRLSAGSKKILEEWGFTNSHTALLMLKRAQKMQSKKQQRKEQGDPSVRFSSLRICSYQWGPAEARNRPALHSRNYIKEREAGPDPQRAGRTEQVRQEREQQGLHTQSDRDSESEHFLPEINSDILNGGRVQLVADPGYTENLHHASGSWTNDSLSAWSSKEANYPRRNSLGQARKEPPSSKQSTSTPLKKERISFRDKPVQLSGGWGGGKKRNKGAPCGRDVVVLPTRRGGGCCETREHCPPPGED